MSVYLIHSEVYYGVNYISYGHLLQPFYVNAFFFISGYLFFRKQLQTVEHYSFAKFGGHLQNILFRLVIPTIVFATIIYLPKLFFHREEVSIEQYFYDVFGGISFWFTSALTISQIILVIFLFYKQKTIFPYLICSVLLFIFSIYLGNIDKNAFPWYYKTGLGITLFLTLGGLYQQYEQKLNHMVNKVSGCLLIGVYIICMMYDMKYNVFQNAAMSMRFNIQGLLMSFVGISVLIIVCKKLPKLNYLEYIGRNSITFYFFSGAFPAFIGLIFQKIFPDKLYIITLIVALLSIFLGYLTTYIIINYFPWLTDFRKLKK